MEGRRIAPRAVHTLSSLQTALLSISIVSISEQATYEQCTRMWPRNDALGTGVQKSYFVKSQVVQIPTSSLYIMIWRSGVSMQVSPHVHHERTTLKGFSLQCG